MHRLTLAFLLSACAACSAPDAPVVVSDLDAPAGPGSMAPSLTRHPDGTLILDWLEPTEDGGYALRYAGYVAGWGAPVEVARGSDWFVNWADFPAVSIAEDGRWTAHWLQREAEGSYAYGIRVVSSDDGADWSAPITPHRDGTATEHGFVGHYEVADGAGMVWLDGREMQGEAHGGHDDHGGGGMTLRHAMLRADGSLAEEVLLDGLTCDCCQTDVAMAAQGPVIVYRDRTEDEIRDIYVIRRTADGWSAPAPVHADGWEMDACPVNGPSIATHGDSLAVAWFTAAQGVARIQVARSDDGGASFAAPLLVDDAMPLGRLDLIALGTDSWAIAWYGRAADGPALLMRRFDGDGLGPTVMIAGVSEARRSGFPRMVADGDALVVAWTALDGEVPQVRAARVEGLLR